MLFYNKQQIIGKETLKYITGMTKNTRLLNIYTIIGRKFKKKITKICTAIYKAIYHNLD